MCKRCMKAIAVLAVLVVSLISVSSAAGPRAMPDLYKGQCGVELSVPAPGILANDLKLANPLQVKDPDQISIDSKYGTLIVNEDGSFIYDVAESIAPGTYVTFKYWATDGKKTTQALVKIQISCVCRGTAPDVTVCPGTKITPNLLISEGAVCTGCRDVMPKFDLRKIPAHPVAGACYPYTVHCLGCVLVKGSVCFSDSCRIASTPFTVCSDVIPTIEMIEANGEVSCGDDCDSTAEISDIHMVRDQWKYTITCTTDDCTTKETGIVNIDQRCGFVSEPVGFTNPIENCPDTLPTEDQIIAQAGLECTCDATPVISDIHWIETDENGVLIGGYTATAGSLECGSSVTGQFEASGDYCQ